MRTVLIYEVNTMEFGDTGPLAWVLASDLFWSMAITSFRCANLMARQADSTPSTLLISFRSRNLVRKTTKQAVIQFNCM